MENTTELLAIQANFSSIEAGDGWSAGRQAGMQAAALGVSIGMALVGGLITGVFSINISFAVFGLDLSEPVADYGRLRYMEKKEHTTYI